jgi:hypothetical protein
LTKQLIAYFQSPEKKILEYYYYVAFRGRRWFIDLKMAISKQFKLLNLKKKTLRKLFTDDQNEEKWQKNTFCNLRKRFFFLFLSFGFFFGCSFGFAFQRWICRAWEGAPI